jgi:hypothetical protein
MRKGFTTKAQGRDSPQRHKGHKGNQEEASSKFSLTGVSSVCVLWHEERTYHKGTKAQRKSRESKFKILSYRCFLPFVFFVPLW